MITYCQLSLKVDSSKALVIIALLIISGIQISLSPYKSKVDRHNENSRILEDIEAIMFVDQHSLDSLVSLIDTINITPFELARLSTIRAKIHFDNGDFAKSIGEVEKADSIFFFHNDAYHQTLNKFIKATVLEKLLLFNTASELYLECDRFFNENHYDKYRFHTSLGIVRMNNELKISTNEIIKELKNDIKNFNDPLYTGLYYATMGNIGANDSVKKFYYELAKSKFLKVQSWSRVYTIELNILNIIIRQDLSENAQHSYYAFSEKEYPYSPNKEQLLLYLFAEGYLFAKHKEYSRAIDITNEVFKKARSLKSSRIEMQCVNLLEFLYKQNGDFTNAYRMLVSYNNYRKKEMDSLEQVRLLALGSHYHFTKLENDRLKLISRIQIMIFISGFVFMFFVSGMLFFNNKIKQAKLNHEILSPLRKVGAVINN